jgi:hypothetical protein
MDRAPGHKPEFRRVGREQKQMLPNRRKGLLVGSLALALATMLGAAVPATSAPIYDGLWSVVIVTETGTCDRAYRYPVRIANGTLVNAGNSAVSITGSVRDNGAIIVTLSSGHKDATASGRLSGTTGAGSWRGRDCAGTWEAERRGG